jgi:hypothetical protein
MSATMSIGLSGNRAIFTDVNMSNSNTRLVLTALGFDSEFENTGAIEGQEFLGACERYLTSGIADILDNGREASMVGGGEAALLTHLDAVGCAIIDCGVRPGYITNRVKQMIGWARLAARQEGRVYFA